MPIFATFLSRGIVKDLNKNIKLDKRKKTYKKKSFLSVGKIREYGEMDKITGFTGHSRCLVKSTGPRIRQPGSKF